MALVDVIMPQLGESIAEGTISKWHKKKGDAIAMDETLLEISTDKVDSEIPSPAAGIIEELLFPEQETVPVLTIIARIRTGAAAVGTSASPLPEPRLTSVSEAAGTGSETAPAARTHAPHGRSSEQTIVQDSHSAHSPAPQSHAGAEPRPAPHSDARTAAQPVSFEAAAGRFYSPLVVNIARTENIRMEELERIEGTGVAGRVTKNDVLAYVERKKRGGTGPVQSKPSSVQAGAGTGDVRVQMDAMRRSIAEHMVRSKQVSPHVYSVTEADVSKLAAFRERMKAGFEQREGIKLTLTPFFLDATVNALKEFPYINASIDGDSVVLKSNIHLGVAVAVDKGLIVPVIRHAGEKNLAGLAAAAADLAHRARTKKLMPDEVQGGTFTVTNPGMVGNLYGIPIINQPQVAILAIGAVKKRAVVVDDAIAIRSMVYLSLSYDHRIIDGMMGGLFLERIVELLENFDTRTIL
jgi:pyruvate/2-oxoglutarate dehydrogenase complex dihydrolipoamide acyltransferase (E2) component